MYYSRFSVFHHKLGFVDSGTIDQHSRRKLSPRHKCPENHRHIERSCTSTGIKESSYSNP